jgi:uncharacterized protein (DUF608 family)
MNRAERLMYAERFPGAEAVARRAAARWDDWLARIVRWQSVLYARADLPDAMKEALVNSFYSICKNAHWIAKYRPDDWFPAEGLLLVNESLAVCPLSETLPCHYLGGFPVLLFFPELERTTLEAYRHFQLSTGEVPFALANGFGARTPFYPAQHPNRVGEYIELVCRLWLRTGDPEILGEMYPSARAALDYLEFLDTDGDGLVDEHSHALPGERFPANVPWDQWPQSGTSVYTAMKSLASCLALERMAIAAGDMDTARHCRERVEKGRARLEALLWNGAYYDLSCDAGVPDHDCLLAQVTGVWAAALLGVECPVPMDRVRSCVAAIRERLSKLSAYGYVLASHEDGSPTYSNFLPNCDFPRDVWPLYNFIYTAVCRLAGEDETAAWEPTLRTLEALFHAANAMPWGWPCCLSALDGWEGHGHDYQDPLAIWTIPMLSAGQDVAAGSSAGSLVDAILKA